jgi:hypothetical protein
MKEAKKKQQCWTGKVHQTKQMPFCIRYKNKS